MNLSLSQIRAATTSVIGFHLFASQALSYPLYAKDIWQGGQLNEDACRRFYELLGQIRAGGGASLKNTAPFDRPDSTYYHPQNSTLSNFTNCICRAFCSPVYSLNALGGDFYYASRVGGANAGEVKALATASGTTSIQPVCAAGVNVSAQNPEGAVQFIKIMLSEDVPFLRAAQRGGRGSAAVSGRGQSG